MTKNPQTPGLTITLWQAVEYEKFSAFPDVVGDGGETVNGQVFGKPHKPCPRQPVADFI